VGTELPPGSSCREAGRLLIPSSRLPPDREKRDGSMTLHVSAPIVAS